MKTIQPYILPRPFNGYNIPGAIQSAYLKNYALNNNFSFSLPIVEITTSSSFYLLKGYLNNNEIDNLQIGIVSAFVFPIYDKFEFQNLFNDYIDTNLTIHSVLEAKVFKVRDFIEWGNKTREINALTYTYNSKSTMELLNLSNNED